MNAVIMQCVCKHASQDKLHGKGKRVFNPTILGSGKETTYRCTVCLHEKAKSVYHAK